jgi:hypothetical protein
MPVIAKDAIVIWLGRSHVINGRVVKADGSPQDLTGATVYWWVGKSAHAAVEADVYLRKSTRDGGIAITDTAAGAYTVTIKPEDTRGQPVGRHYYEVAVEDGTGNIVTVNAGPCVFRPTLPGLEDSA